MREGVAQAEIEPSMIACFEYRTASGAFCRTSRAISSARSRRRSAGTTSVIRPMRYASSAPMR